MSYSLRGSIGSRNHAAFWNGKDLSLTPAFDICPQARTGNEANQAMLLYGNNRSSKLSICLEAAPHFLLKQKTAQAMIKRIKIPLKKNGMKCAMRLKFPNQQDFLLRLIHVISPPNTTKSIMNPQNPGS